MQLIRKELQKNNVIPEVDIIAGVEWGVGGGLTFNFFYEIVRTPACLVVEAILAPLPIGVRSSSSSLGEGAVGPRLFERENCLCWGGSLGRGRRGGGGFWFPTELSAKLDQSAGPLSSH